MYYVHGPAGGLGFQIVLNLYSIKIDEKFEFQLLLSRTHWFINLPGFHTLQLLTNSQILKNYPLSLFRR